MKIPESLRNIIERHQEDGVDDTACQNCSSACCSHGGFAILENVLEIYKLYQKGKLKRKGFKFEKGLDLEEFIFRYFDVWTRDVGPEGEERPLVFFHLRSIDEKGRPISIPGDSYWEVRSELFENNPWLNRGCVFLSHPVLDPRHDDGNNKRHCILHQPTSLTHMGPKPIDCVFFTCLEPLEPKFPDSDVSDEWFSTLDKEFPNSQERLKAIMGESEVDD